MASPHFLAAHSLGRPAAQHHSGEKLDTARVSVEFGPTSSPYPGWGHGREPRTSSTTPATALQKTHARQPHFLQEVWRSSICKALAGHTHDFCASCHSTHPPQVASECQNWRVAVKRIKPNIRSYRFDESRDFYTGVFELVESEGLDWILFFGTDQREVQLSVMKMDVAANVHPDVSIEVDNLDAVYQRAREAGAEIVYPLTEEEWGLRRFFVRDPNGAVLNVTEHR